MADIQRYLTFPLDDEGYFRRECPYCHKEFKVMPEKDDFIEFDKEFIDSISVANESIEGEKDPSDISVFTCPYCNQKAPMGDWWTREQNEYIRVVAKNIIAKIVNEKLIKPLKRNFGKPSSGMISIKFKGQEIKRLEEWIGPEPNDMKIVDLPCCGKKVKIDDGWSDKIFCYYCGFPHEMRSR